MNDLDAAIGALGGGSSSAPRGRAPNDLMQADSEAEALYQIKSGLTKRSYLKGQKPDFSETGGADTGQTDDLSGAIEALSGASASSPKPAAPAPSQKTQAEAGALPDTTVGRIASGALGEAKGAFDLVVRGPAQLLSKGIDAVYPSNWPGAEFFHNEAQAVENRRKKSNEDFERITANTQSSAKAGEVAGGIVGAMALPQGKAAEGANLFNRMIAAAKTGGVIGLATPTDDKDFWTNKTLQTGLSAATAFLAQPLAEGVGKVVGGAINSAASIGQRVLNWATGQGSDATVSAAMQKASPELKQAIQKITASGGKVDPAALGRQVEADSLPVKMSLTAGQATQDPHLISTEMNTRGLKDSPMSYKLQDQGKHLFENLHAVRDMAAPEATAPDSITAGTQLIKAGQDLIEKQSTMTTALYKKLSEANGGNLPLDGVAIADQASAALKREMKAPFLPSEVKTLIDDMKGGEKFTFENFENLRTILASASRKAERAGDGNTVAAIHIVRDALENSPISSNVSGVKELADAARKSARFGFDMLKSNPALKAIDAEKAADNNFVQKYIIGASKKDLENLAGIFQHDPQTLQTIKAGVVNYLEQQAGSRAAGNFSQAAYNKALQSLGPKLDVLFNAEEAGYLRTIGNVARYTQLAPRGAYVNSSNTDVANLARQGGGMAAKFIDRVFGVPVGSAAQTAAEAALEKRASSKTLGQIVNVGAGVQQPSNAENFLLGTFPRAAGRAAVLPLSVFAGKTVADERRNQARKGQ